LRVKADIIKLVNDAAVYTRKNCTTNQITGAASLGSVGLEWQLGGFAVDPRRGSMGDSSDAAQLTQAMAGFKSFALAARVENLGAIAEAES